MRTKFFKEVLLPLIEQATQSVDACGMLNEAYGFDETPNQKSQRIVLEELTTLKENYDTLTDQEIQQKFREIIRKNPPTKRPTYRESFRAWWREVYRRAYNFGRTRQSGKGKRT